MRWATYKANGHQAHVVRSGAWRCCRARGDIIIPYTRSSQTPASASTCDLSSPRGLHYDEGSATGHAGDDLNQYARCWRRGKIQEDLGRRSNVYWTGGISC